MIYVKIRCFARYRARYLDIWPHVANMAVSLWRCSQNHRHGHSVPSLSDIISVSFIGSDSGPDKSNHIWNDIGYEIWCCIWYNTLMEASQGKTTLHVSIVANRRTVYCRGLERAAAGPRFKSLTNFLFWPCPDSRRLIRLKSISSPDPKVVAWHGRHPVPDSGRYIVFRATSPIVNQPRRLLEMYL